MPLRAFAATVAPAALALLVAQPAAATGLVTCDSGPESGWQPQAALQQQLVQKGWDVRRIKVDGGCSEVDATDPEGRPVESYFHPASLEHLRSLSR